MRFTISTDNAAAKAYYLGLKASLLSAQSEAEFAVANTAHDPKTGEYYYPYVDEGRGEIVAKNSPKKFLRIATAPGEFVFRKSVGASRPRRITDSAQAGLRDALHKPLLEKVNEAAQNGRIIDGDDLRDVFATSKKLAILAFQEACRRTITSRNFERDEETPRLIDSFVIVEVK